MNYTLFIIVITNHAVPSVEALCILRHQCYTCY